MDGEKPKWMNISKTGETKGGTSTAGSWIHSRIRQLLPEIPVSREKCSDFSLSTPGPIYQCHPVAEPHQSQLT